MNKIEEIFKEYIKIYEEEHSFNHWITAHMICSSHGSLWNELMYQFDVEGNGLDEFLTLAKQMNFYHDLDKFHFTIEFDMLATPERLYKKMMNNIKIQPKYYKQSFIKTFHNISLEELKIKLSKLNKFDKYLINTAHFKDPKYVYHTVCRLEEI
jgi:hypothetical protein